MLMDILQNEDINASAYLKSGIISEKVEKFL